MNPKMAVTAVALHLAAGPAQAAVVTATYRCSDGSRLVASFETPADGPGSVTLAPAADGKPLVLPQSVSADGGRYAAGDTLFWIKGRQATFTRTGHTLICQTAP